MSAWHEFRERRLIQIVLAYLVMAWGTLELLNLLVERGVIADWIWTVVFVLALFGIPASIIIGWYHGEKGAQSVPRAEIALLSVVALAGLGTSGWMASGALAGGGADDPAGELREMAVLYFETADPTLRPVADGVTEALIEQLRGVQALDVPSANAVRPFRGGQVGADSVGRALDVGAVVDGTVERDSDGRVRVTAALREAGAGGLIERATIAVPEGEVLALVDSVSVEIARLLRRNLGEEVETRRDRAATGSSDAWLLLQRGRAAWKEGEELVAHDPDAARAALGRADSLFAEAARADSTWLRPGLERAELAYFESRHSRDLEFMETAIDRSVQHAEGVLEADPSHPEALAVRGTARYWRQLLPIDDHETRERLREEAREDLERAVRLDPERAMAHSTLSHLYYVDENIWKTVTAARDALQADAYLSDADNVMWRLFWGLYDMATFREAETWCREGARRFPDDHRFALCQLILMTAPSAEADPERARRLADRVDSLLPHAEETPDHYLARLVVGGVLGRASQDAALDDSARAALADSARAVLARSRPPVEVDPERELLGVEAFMHRLAGDDDEAIRVLQRYVAANPDHRFQEGAERSWWWDGLEDHPGYQSLIRGP